jgi:SagB-type dehydrogenase family enzyme
MAERSIDDLLGIRTSAEPVWELFHENSKNFRASLGLGQMNGVDIQREMQRFHETLPYAGYEARELPPPARLEMSLQQAIAARCSTRELSASALTLPQVAALLHYAYGMLRPNEFTPFPARTRAVASAGALYPLELYIHAARVSDLPPALYHYDPKGNALQRLRALDASDVCAASLYPDYVRGAALTVFVTAIFERSTWKYGARGYRYALMEAGEVAHALALAAAALGLGSFNLGGFIDREADELLDIDGVNHSTLHMACVGGAEPSLPEPTKGVSE